MWLSCLERRFRACVKRRRFEPRPKYYFFSVYYQYNLVLYEFALLFRLLFLQSSQQPTDSDRGRRRRLATCLLNKMQSCLMSSEDDAAVISDKW